MEIWALKKKRKVCGPLYLLYCRLRPAVFAVNSLLGFVISPKQWKMEVSLLIWHFQLSTVAIKAFLPIHRLSWVKNNLYLKICSALFTVISYFEGEKSQKLWKNGKLSCWPDIFNRALWACFAHFCQSINSIWSKITYI